MNLSRVFLLLVAAAALPAQETKDILHKLAGITGLAMLKPVNQISMKREDLKAYFEERIKEVVKPEEIRIEELALKKMGFVPAEFDLKKTTVELMAEQAAAFYDYRKKQMVMLDNGSGMMQDLALVHELAHALADQHFQLEKFLKKAGANDDGALARMAVMEGQATWLMSEFMAQKMGQSLKDSEAVVEMMSRMAGAAGSGFPIFQSVPLYMRESLIFPYGQGMLFQHRVVAKLGKEGFAEVFRRPPQSTQEILHPEKYFNKVAPVKVRLPELDKPREWKLLAEGSVGEFDHKILLRQFVPSSEALAEQWTGGSYRLWEHRKTRRVVLVYGSAWSNEQAAGEFFSAYRDVLTKKWKETQFAPPPAAALLSGSSEEGRFRARLEGAVITSVEGLADPTAAAGRAQ